MSAVADLDRSEALLWTILAGFESRAAEQYARFIPELLTPEKEAVLALLLSRVHDDRALAGTPLQTPISGLMHSVTTDDALRVLVAQGLLLELIGDAIYRSFGENAVTSAATRELCARGSAASGRARSLVPDLLRARIGTGDVLLQAIMTESAPLLRTLDDLGEGIDATFFERYGVSFADLMGDVAAELIADCIELDVDRRKLVAFLTGALMGS